MLNVTKNISTNKQKSICIIDKDKSINTILEFIFQQQGFNTISSNHKITFNTLFNFQINMFIIDEITATEHNNNLLTKLESHFQTIPILIMTGKNFQTSLKNGYLHNIIGFIYKPIDTEEMITIVNETIYKKELC